MSEKKPTSEGLHNFLRTRRSIRKFKPIPVTDEILERILETTIQAPSARNRQPWQFIVIRSEPARKSLADSLAENFRQELTKDGLNEEEISARLERTRKRIQGSPVVIVICLDTNRIDKQADEKRKQIENTMAIQSVALGGLQLMLAAHAEGLGTVWTGSPLFAERSIRTALNLPPEWEPEVMIFMGYPAESPEMPERKSIQEIAQFM